MHIYKWPIFFGQHLLKIGKSFTSAYMLLIKKKKKEKKKKKNLPSYLYSWILTLVLDSSQVSQLLPQKNYIPYAFPSILYFLLVNTLNMRFFFKEYFMSGLTFIFLSNLASRNRDDSWVTKKIKFGLVEILGQVKLI